MTGIEKLRDRLLLSGVDAKRLLMDEPMSRHTTFRLGGPADLMLCAGSGAEIALALEAARAVSLPTMIMGNGSNLIVKDGGIEGLVIKIGEPMSRAAFDGASAHVGAGCLMSRFGSECVRRGLGGFEMLAGIPGTLGGAAAMNAGAYGGEMKQLLLSASVIRDGRAEVLRGDELDMGYRTSRILREGLAVIELELRLEAADPAELRRRADDFAARRRSKQPLSMPSAGSTFKRPEGHFAGALIEQCGLKGIRIGGAQVSEIHAGFIVNAGGASARDILDLIALVQEKVRHETGVGLETEVRIVGRE